MRLDPVYLVAPRPQPRTIGRRALCGIAVLCLAAGFLGGFTWRAAASPGAVDSIVDWARSVAADPTRADVLRQQYHGFLHALDRTPQDPDLWQAFGRIVANLESQPAKDPRVQLTAASMREALHAHAPAHPEAPTWDERLRALGAR
jgi:hypothetical protein